MKQAYISKFSMRHTQR